MAPSQFYCADSNNFNPTSIDLIPEDTKCLNNHFTGLDKIVNGETVVANSWPWTVAMMIYDQYQMCGGTIITNEWILTVRALNLAIPLQS